MDKKNTKKDKGIIGLLLVLAWLLFVLMAVCFYYFFIGNGKKKTNDDNKSATESNEKDTVFSYKTNENIEINALIGDYYSALVKCDAKELKACVTDGSKFDDMSSYESAAKIIIGYTNINCYSVPGYTKDATLVYVTSNLHINGIESKPMDIQTFYIIKSDNAYRIYNEGYNKEVSDYIEKVQADSDIQNLYKSVRNNVEDCKLKDEKFKELWNTLYGE